MQALTHDVCNHCWGSGDTKNIWPRPADKTTDFIAGIRQAKQLLVRAVMEINRTAEGEEELTPEIKKAVRFSFKGLEAKLNIVIEQAHASPDLAISMEE